MKANRPARVDGRRGRTQGPHRHRIHPAHVARVDNRRTGSGGNSADTDFHRAPCAPTARQARAVRRRVLRFLGQARQLRCPQESRANGSVVEAAAPTSICRSLRMPTTPCWTPTARTQCRKGKKLGFDGSTVTFHDIDRSKAAFTWWLEKTPVGDVLHIGEVTYPP